MSNDVNNNLRSPFGINQTKRTVSPLAEDDLYNIRKIYANGEIELVDYIGSDEMIERVATGGHDRRIFKQTMGRREIFSYMLANGIVTPFASSQVKVSVQQPIDAALSMVYSPRVSLNEYSGRYSVMLDSAHLPSSEEILSRMRNPDIDKAMDAHQKIVGGRKRKSEAYSQLLETGLTRELARSILGTDNDTRFYWKIDLFSLAEFIKMQKRSHRINRNVLGPYLEELEAIGRHVAPEAFDVLMQDNPYLLPSMNLDMPPDDKVVDGPLNPPSWKIQETRRVIVPGLEKILFEPVHFLNYGEVQAVDYMGDDAAIAQAARTSYQRGTKQVSDDYQLIRSLVRDRHTSPLEMVELAVEGKNPMFTDPRQAGRHRTLDFVGFMGYVPIGSEVYIPSQEELKEQDRKNRQGRGKDLDSDQKQSSFNLISGAFEEQRRVTRELMELGVAEEDIRRTKGVGTFSRIWRTGDAHNWGHFLHLRLDPHAQAEVRAYAQIIDQFYKAHVPIAHKSVHDYIIEGMDLSAIEIIMMKKIIQASGGNINTLDLNNLDNFKGAGWVVPVDKEDLSKGKKLTREGEKFVIKLRSLLEQSVDGFLPR